VDALKISYSDLVKIFKTLSDALEEGAFDPFDKSAGKEVAFVYDYYWDVPSDKRYCLQNEPKLDVGSLSHDIERVRQLIEDGEEHFPLSEHFRWLGGVLIAMADTLGNCTETDLMP